MGSFRDVLTFETVTEAAAAVAARSFFESFGHLLDAAGVSSAMVSGKLAAKTDLQKTSHRVDVRPWLAHRPECASTGGPISGFAFPQVRGWLNTYQLVNHIFIQR